MELCRSTVITTGATRVLILAENNNRTSFYLTNSGGVAVTLVKGDTTPVVGQGLILQPNNTWFESDTEGFKCWKGRISAISSAASTIAIQETAVG